MPGSRGRKHCLPEIVTNIWHGRDEAKRQGNKPLSQALKIIMNAFYGVLGTTACRFFDPRLASSITMRGHQIMRQTKALIEAGLRRYLRRYRLNVCLAERRTFGRRSGENRSCTGAAR